MRIIGVDFTSSPSLDKPITVAIGELEGNSLHVETITLLRSFEEFEQLLAKDGSWFGGCDFPFGLPRRFIENVNWPKSWPEYVDLVSQMSRAQFVDFMRAYQSARPKGDKRHFREVDRLARSCSPMQLDYVPVGKMFFEGAKRLLHSECSVYPFCSKLQNERVVIEAYPALVARHCVGSTSYKSERKSARSEELRETRLRLLDMITRSRSNGGDLEDRYGLSVGLTASLATECVADGTGDRLDAVLCAIQAAWSYRMRDNNYGIPLDCDLIEGWIVDPSLLDVA